MYFRPCIKKLLLVFLLSFFSWGFIGDLRAELADPDVLTMDIKVQELSMNDAIRIAVLNNPQIKIEEANIEQKKWAIKENQSYLYPQLYVYQDFMASNNPVQAFMMQLNQRNFNMTAGNLNYPGTECNFSTRVGGTFNILDRSIYKKVSLSKLELEIQRQIGKKALFDLVRDVRKSYLDVQVAKEQVNNANANLDYAKAHLKAVTDKKDQGTASKSDYLGAKAKVSAAEENLTRAKNGLNLSWINFADLLGDDSVVGYDLIDRMSDDYPVDDIDKLVKYSFLHRPEIQEVETSKEKAVTNLKLAKSTGALTLKAHGAWGVDTILDDRNIARSYTAGVFLNKSLFDGGLRKSKIKQAQANIDKRDAEIDQIYKKIKLEVVQNYLSLVNAQDRLKKTNDLVSDAEESLRAYNERYLVGLSNSVEVESAQSKLSDARILRTHSLYDLKMAVINLQRSMGIPLSDILLDKGLVVTAEMTDQSSNTDINQDSEEELKQNSTEETQNSTNDTKSINEIETIEKPVEELTVPVPEQSDKASDMPVEHIEPEQPHFGRAIRRNNFSKQQNLFDSSQDSFKQPDSTLINKETTQPEPVELKPAVEEEVETQPEALEPEPAVEEEVETQPEALEPEPSVEEEVETQPEELEPEPAVEEEVETQPEALEPEPAVEEEVETQPEALEPEPAVEEKDQVKQELQPSFEQKLNNNEPQNVLIIPPDPMLEQMEKRYKRN